MSGCSMRERQQPDLPKQWTWGMVFSKFFQRLTMTPLTNVGSFPLVQSCDLKIMMMNMGSIYWRFKPERASV